MKKTALIWILLVLSVVFFLIASRNWIVKYGFEAAIRALTGFDVSIRTAELDLGQGKISLKTITVLNPGEFEGRIFADIPEISIEIDMPDFLEGKRIFIYGLKINIRELNIEKNEKGVFNIALLNTIGKPKEIPVPAGGIAAAKKPEKFYVRNLELTMRKVNYRDHSGLIPINLSTDMKVENEKFLGIVDPGAIVNLIVLNLLEEAKLGDFGISPIRLGEEVKENMNASLEDGKKYLTEKAESARRGAQDVLRKTGKEADGIAEAFRKKWDKLREGVADFIKA